MITSPASLTKSSCSHRVTESSCKYLVASTFENALKTSKSKFPEIIKSIGYFLLYLSPIDTVLNDQI